MYERRRVAAAIIRDGAILMVREFNRGPTGRHDGVEFWTLPGGGIEEGESDDEAVRREVFEEVGLLVGSARYLFEFPYPSGHTAVYAVEVDDGEPRLGIDPDLDCDCPRMVGLDWIPLPEVKGEAPGPPIPTMIVATDFSL